MATIRLHNDCPNTYVSVPGNFINKYMTDANGEFVKVYLYLLYCMNTPSCECSVSAIADHFNHTENDVLRALKFWEKAGVLRLELNKANEICQVTLVDLNAPSAVPTETPYKNATECSQKTPVIAEDAIIGKKNTSSSKSKTSDSIDSPTKENISTATAKATSSAAGTEKKEYSLNEIQKFSQDPDMEELLFIMETYLKHPLSSSDMNTVFFWIDSLKFSKDLAEYLVEYCIGGGHSSLRYMDKVAMGWSEDGITTVEQAKSHSSNRSKSCYGVMKALGISGRNLIDSEVAFVNKWTRDFGFDMTLIEEACKRTISSIHQPSFEYTDTILTNWYNKQVHNLKDIEALDASFSKTKKAASTSRTVNSAKNNKFINFNQRSYDFELLEKDILTTSAQ
jgi:DnaD/phage-associated family protein